MSKQVPSVGRVVHYVSHGTPIQPDGTQAFTAQCRAAVVTEVGEDGAVGLCVLNPTGQFFQRDCREALGTVDHKTTPPTVTYPGGTWHWPERV